MNSAAPAGKRRKRPGRLVFLRIITILIGLITGLSVTEVGLRIVEKVQLGDRATAATVDILSLVLAWFPTPLVMMPMDFATLLFPQKWT